MRGTTVGAAFLAILALANLAGVPSAAGAPTPLNASGVTDQVEKTFDVENVECRHGALTDGTLAPSRRFTCRLPLNEGVIQIRVSPSGTDFAVVGRSVHRTVAAESTAEARAAKLIDGWTGVTHVVCSRRVTKAFLCDANFAEEGFSAGVEVMLRFREHDFYGISECRLTKLGAEPRAIFACQHLTGTIDMTESTLQGLGEESARP